MNRYVILVAWFLFRVLRRRAKRAKDQKLAGQVTQAEYDQGWFAQMRSKLAPKINIEEAQRGATAFDALLGAAQAAGLGLGLYIFSTKMTLMIGSSPLPDNYTAKNISITVRTLIEGLSWLATFVFIFNSVGLTGWYADMCMPSCTPASMRSCPTTLNGIIH